MKKQRNSNRKLALKKLKIEKIIIKIEIYLQARKFNKQKLKKFLNRQNELKKR